MADAKDILGLPKVSSVLGGGSEKRRAPKEPVKKPDGVSREVYALTGGLPPVVPSLDAANLKKRQLVASKKVVWQWHPFTNSARGDNLQLYHWVRVVDGVQPTGDYAFSKYNKAVEVVRYTDEEYAKYLPDPNWSRQETDQLFDLCEQFDLRFIIIADRFTTPRAVPRTVEELKSRYYSAAKAILLGRAVTAEDVTDHTLVKDTYNVQYEVERKRALGILWSQTRQQQREDDKVLAEAKSIREARQNAKIAEAAVPIQVPAPDTNLHADVTEKSPQTPARPTSPLLSTPSIPSAGPVFNATPTPAPVSSGLAVSGAPNATSSGPRAPRVFLRATLLAQMVQASVTAAGVRTSKRVDQMLEELGVRSKAKVPTKAVFTEHLELRKEVQALFNLQKQVQWKEAEVSVLRDNPYADIPTPSTPKRSHRANDHERVSTRATAGGLDTDGFPGDRLGKREHKRKAPARFSEAPPSPPHHKRARKLKASDN
ncbi:unnamed protein product [Calypogeia fissa]